MEYNSFKLQISDHIANVSFDRVSKANSLNENAWEEMKLIFDYIDKNDDVRVVILSGEGKHFCAGMDLETLMNLQSGADIKCEARKREKLRDFIVKIQNCITSIELCKKPVLAAIHNGCIGGGVDIISACDIRYAAEDAYFSIKEIDLGIVADIGTLQRLPTIIPPGIMAELAYTGRKLVSVEAKSIGLVNEIWENKEIMLAKVTKIAKTIAEKSPLCISGIKKALIYKRDHSVDDSLSQIADYNAAMLISEDLYKAMAANLNRSKPTF